jgi:hypothetical protein
MATNSLNTGTQSLNYSTDFNLKKLNLITSMVGDNGIINLMPLMVELDLYEDIYSSTISGEIVLSDALGLIPNYKLNGTEFIEVQLQKTENDQQYISRNYRVYKISKRIVNSNNTFENYVINFCSEEFLLSEQYRISKSAKGKMIHETIIDVLTNYLKTKKNFYWEPTKGVYDFILPNKKLFETINWLSTYAQPATGKPGADMLFFENGLGYFFNSLQTLYAQPVYQTYRYDPINIENTNPNTQGVNIQQQVTNAMDFEVLNFFDTLKGIINGNFSNRVIGVDPLLRQITTTDFNYNTYFNQATTLNNFSVTNNYINRLNNTMYDSSPVTPVGLVPGSLRMSPTNVDIKKNPTIAQKSEMINSVANDIMLEKYLPYRPAQLALANYTRIKITVPGDPMLYAGKTVTFNTFAINPTTFAQGGHNAKREYDTTYSGNYLISAVRHIVKNTTYITVMELSKDSAIGSYPAYNDSTQSQYVNGIQS